MNVQDTVLMREVERIFTTGNKPIAHRWECILHANGKNYTANWVVSVDNTRNYIENFSDERVVVAMFPGGTLSFDVFPYRENLEVTLKKHPVGAKAGTPADSSRKVESYRYRAHLFKSSSDVIESNNPTMAKKSVADRAQLMEIKLQLIDPVTEYVRMQTIGGVFRNTSGADLIRAVLGKYSKLAPVDQLSAVKGVDIAPGANPEIREHIVIPHMTPLIKFPRIVNKVCGGVYSTGFTYYLQGNIWYIFPPYDVKRFNTAMKTLTVINIPNNRLPHPESSYRETLQQVIVIATGQTKQTDISEREQLNKGNGVRFMDGLKLFNEFAKVIDNKAITKVNNVVNEFVSSARDTALNFVSQGDVKISSNLQLELSKLAQREGTFVQVVWQNSLDRLIFPGMPVKYVFLQNDQPVSLTGIVVGTDTHESVSNQDPTRKKHMGSTAITMFLDRNVKLEM